MDHDVIVVGAGPVGARLATVLAERGVDVLMLEEHASIGRPFQCAGLVNPWSMAEVGLEHTVLQEIDGATIHGPHHASVSVGVPGETRTSAVCRNRFDEGVVEQAIRAGAKLRLSTTATGLLSIDGEGWRVHHQQGSVAGTTTCRLVVGADGAHSRVRHWLRSGRPKEIMIGNQVEVTGFETEDRWLEMFTGESIAPGFFAWAIPTGFGTHRIGLWSSPERLDESSPESLLHALMHTSRHAKRFANCQIVARYCGPIPGGMVRRPVRERAMLFGDAAGLAKPTTGGGIGPGFKQVSMVADTLAQAIHADKLSEDHLKKIARPWDELRRHQTRARALRNLFLTESDDDTLERHVSVFAKPEVTAMINRLGDIEHPVPLGIEMLRKVPSFRPLALKAGWAMLTA
ncbi:MAG: geranylgeranyl reductase family protein [Candidatus Poseidoniaceae archaeon]